MRLEKELGQIAQNLIDLHRYFYFERELELPRALEQRSSRS